MKKYLALLLMLPVMAFAQDKGNFSELNESFLSKGNKKIDYELSITEGDTLIFKSDFSVMNGERLTLFKREIHGEKEVVFGKKLSLDKESLSQETDVNKEKIGSIEILRLTSEITRDTENIITQFSLTNMDLGVELKEAKKKSVDKDAPNGSYNEENPEVEKVMSEVSVSHQKNKDILFMSNSRTYYVKAKY